MTGVLSACGALLIVFITQWIIARRARTEILTKKLEELFLLVNDASVENGNRYNAAQDLFRVNRADPSAERKDVVHLSRNLPLDHKINMYVQLYFPDVRETQREVAAINQDMVAVFHKLSDRSALEPREILAAFLDMNAALTAFRKELVDNRARLVREPLYRVPYVRCKIKRISVVS
jgi:hypothetical protein